MERAREFARKYGVEIFCLAWLLCWVVGSTFLFFMIELSWWLAGILGLSGGLATCLFVGTGCEAFMLYIWKGTDEKKISGRGRILRIIILFGYWLLFSIGLKMVGVSDLVACLSPLGLILLVSPTAVVAQMKGDVPADYDSLGTW